jgi:hypothetical protein
VLTRHEGSERFLVDATGAFMPDRQTLLAVRVVNESGPGGIFGPVKVVARRDEQPYVAKPGNYAVLDLDFAADDDGRVLDRSGFENHGTLHGAEIMETDRGRVARFEPGHTLSVPDAPKLGAWNGRRSWEIYFTPGGDIPDSPSVYHILLAKSDRYSDGLYLTQESRPRKIVFRQAATAEVSTNVGNPEAWHHVVGTYDGRLSAPP